MVRELRSHMAWGQKKDINIATNSIKSLKMVHIKKKNLKKKRGPKHLEKGDTRKV